VSLLLEAVVVVVGWVAVEAGVLGDAGEASLLLLLLLVRIFASGAGVAGSTWLLLVTSRLLLMLLLELLPAARFLRDRLITLLLRMPSFCPFTYPAANSAYICCSCSGTALLEVASSASEVL
jgi:hypothetical protein